MTNYQHELYFAHCHGHPKKPLEIYMFVDPLCPECWSLEPVIKKLKIRYGRFFTLRIIASASLTALNKKRKKHLLAEAWEKIASRSGMSCDGNVWITIIGNLINNGLDAVADMPKKQITMSMRFHNSILDIEITDTGAGMSEEDQAKVFEQGYSTKGKNRGFGLYFTQQSIENLKGQMILTSEKNEGTTFSIRIPYEPKEENHD